MTKKFYDTNAILNNYDKLFEISNDSERFVISSQTLIELENIKTSSHKDADIKYKARKACRVLDENIDKYDVSIDSEVDLGLSQTPDNIIMTGAYRWNKDVEPIVFSTNDVACRTIANKVYGLDVESVCEEDLDNYTGFKEVLLSEDGMAYFYEHLDENIYTCLTNEYLVIRNLSGELVDKFRWDGINYTPIKVGNIKSTQFGVVKPYDGDIYQQMALNSFSNNQITMIKGVAGTGKTHLSIGFLLSQLEKHKVEKIIIFCNTVATLNSARLGFYPGTKDEKLLDSQIGNMLSAKLGGISEVERMIRENKLQLLPMSDIRGFDTTNMNACVYITEAQNLDISLMKLALQRIGEDCTCIIDGDCKTQVDDMSFAGSRNGMRRLSEVFRGQDFYGEIELQNIYRGKIAKVAEKM